MKALTSIAAVVVLVGGFAVTLAQEQIFESGPGITLPIPIKEVKPQYTPGAMKERIQGTVWLKVDRSS